MTVLSPAPVSTRQITYDAKANLLVAEASTLGMGHGVEFERVYNDACDVGLTLVSHITGRRVVYVVEDIKRDAEGDLLYWTLTPANLGERRGLPNLRIYND